MKILHLNTYDDKGGAARAARRLHVGCRAIGLDSRMLVQFRGTRDPTIDGAHSGRPGWIISKGREVLDTLPVYRYSLGVGHEFSPAWLPDEVGGRLREGQHDVLHLHWVTNGFLRPETIAKFDRPVVWTFHDMWPFTGGCHYSGGCDKYVARCGACPVLDSSTDADLSRRVWERKRAALADADVEVVVPSRWLADRVSESSLFSDSTVSVIPNALDTDFFEPTDRGESRDRFGLSRTKQIVLFGGMAADDRRKGFLELRAALEQLEGQGREEGMELAIFGSSLPELDRDLDIPIRDIGYVDDRELPELYSAADVMVVPSRQESFGQTASEAMACGTPVVAFRATGLRDIVDHRKTGYLAEPFEPEDLAAGIEWTLADRGRLDDLSDRARRTARERFDHETVADAYAELYEAIVR